MTLYDFLDKNIGWCLLALVLVLATVKSVADSIGRTK